MTSDPLFDAMRHFAYRDVHRAKRERISKTKWTEHLSEQGRAMADRLGIEISDFMLKRKSMFVARYCWHMVPNVAPPKKAKGSSWGWKKHIADPGAAGGTMH
jgi:hypothetical protein